MTRLLFLTLLVLSCAKPGSTPPLQNGDIIFHTSKSRQSELVQKATRSPWSHMGLVCLEEGEPFVFEAVEPVKLTPFDDWVKRGEGRHYVLKRLRNAEELLTPTALSRMRSVGETFKGRHYDTYFAWSDYRLYCSELVWKVYNRALGLELGRLQRMSDFDLSDPEVAREVRARWNGPPPPDETVISPQAIFESDLLVRILEK